MAILGNKNSLIEDEILEAEDYTVPAVFKHDEKEMSLKKSIFLSAILHPTVVGLVALILFVLMLMGITLSIFDKPKPKMSDIEFVLVDNAKEQTPKNKKTHFRSEHNTRTGGHRDKRRPVSMPSPSPTKKSVQQKSAPSHNAQKRVAKPVMQPKNIFKSLMKPMNAPQARPHPPSARPSIRPPSMPRPTMKPTSAFTVPIPKPNGAPTGRSYSTGPIGGHGTAASGSSSSGTGRSSAPIPSLAPTGGGSSSGSRLSKGGSGYGNPGNPGGGGGAPGVDSIREPDFGPYMRELQRRIKMNWDPPKGNESKRVVLLFKIAKDGRLLSLRVFKSSGIPNADKAALSAVELTAPFRRLPPEFKGSSIDIQFTFDYNVFGASQY